MPALEEKEDDFQRIHTLSLYAYNQNGHEI